MMIPRESPLPRWAASVLNQCEFEGRAAQPAEAIGTATRTRDLPARLRRAGERRWPVAQQKTKPTALTRGERQPLRRREIGNRAILRQLGDDGCQRATLERFFHRP